MIVILYILALLGLSVFGFVKRRYAISLFNAVWAAVIFICRKELVMEQYGLTLFLLALMTVMVNAGYLLSCVQARRKGRPQKQLVRRTYREDMTYVLLVVAGVIFAWYAVRTIMIFKDDLMSIRGFNNANNPDSVFGSVVDTLLFYGVATPLLYTVSLVLAYNFSQHIRTSAKLYVMMGVICLLQMITTGGGRSVFLRIVLFFAAAMIWRMIDGRGFSKKTLLCLIAVGAVFVVLMEAVTYARNQGSITFIGQTMEYIRGAVGHMQYRLTRLDGPQYYGGYVAFGGFLYYPIKVFNAVTGLAIPTSNDLMSYLQQFREVQLYDKTIPYNALVPNAFYFFFDNGYAGVVLFSAILGYAMERVEHVCKRPTFLGFVAWATCVYMIVYSPLDGVLWAFRHPTTIICCVLLANFLYKRTDEPTGGNHETAD